VGVLVYNLWSWMGLFPVGLGRGVQLELAGRVLNGTEFEPGSLMIPGQSPKITGKTWHRILKDIRGSQAQMRNRQIPACRMFPRSLGSPTNSKKRSQTFEFHVINGESALLRRKQTQRLKNLANVFFSNNGNTVFLRIANSGIVPKDASDGRDLWMVDTVSDEGNVVESGEGVFMEETRYLHSR